MNKFSRVYCFLVFFLMLVNIAYITHEYMKYKIETNAAYYFPTVLDMPRVSLCYDMLSFLQEKGLKVNQSHIDVTFDDMFLLVPPLDQVMMSCKHRDTVSDVMVEENNGTQCANYFSSGKFKVMSYLCYRFKYLPSNTYNFHATINSLYEPRVLFSLKVGPPVSGRAVTYPILHIDEYVIEERIMVRQKYIVNNSLFHLANELFESYSLPPPYESGCQQFSKLRCFHECTSKVYEAQGLVWPSSGLDEQSPDAHFKPLMNISQRRGEVDICHRVCDRPACKWKALNTLFSRLPGDGKGFEYVIFSVVAPPLKSTVIPSFMLDDFISHLAALVSMWLGVSFLSLNKIAGLEKEARVKIRTRIRRVQIKLSKLLKSEWTKGKSLMIIERPLSSKNMWFRKLIKVVAFSAMMWQIFNSLSLYLKYGTTMHFGFEIDSTALAPTFAVCKRFEDFFGLSGRITEDNYEEYFAGFNQWTQKSVSDLLAKIDTNGMIKGCRIRDPENEYLTMIDMDARACEEHFNTTPFIMNRHMCFAIQPKVIRLPIDRSDISLMLNDQGIIHSIDFTDKFEFKTAEVYMYFDDVLPSATMPPASINNGQEKREFVFYHQVMRQILLPYPYDTQCVERVNRTNCYPDCLRSKLKRLNRTPHLGLALPSSSIKLLSFSDLTNETIGAELRTYERDCQTACKARSCHHSLMLTYISDHRPMKWMRFTFESIAGAANTIEANPAMNLYGLLFQILCSMSFWIGFSVLSADPFALIAEKGVLDKKKQLMIKLRYIQELINRFNVTKPVARFEMPRITWRLLIRSSIYLTASVACTAHTWVSMRFYLSYPTFIDLSLLADSKTDAYCLLCLDPAELIARKMSHPSSSPLTSQLRTSLLNRTISSIFNLVPHVSEILEGCSYRGLSTRQGKLQTVDEVSDRIFFSSNNRTICNQVYQIEKFLVTGLMCYSLRPRKYTGWTFEQQESALNARSTYHSLTINSSLLTSHFSFMMSLKYYVPKSSSNFGSALSRNSDVNHYSVSSAKFIQVLQPSPRPDMAYPPFTYHRCITRCINNYLARFNLTFSLGFKEKPPSNFRLLNAEDRKTIFRDRPFHKTFLSCEDLCALKNDEAIDSYFSLTVEFPVYQALVESSRLPYIKRDETVINLRMTKVPVFYVTFFRRISFFEQLINLGSIIGIWFGYNLLGLSQLGEPSLTTEISRIEKSISVTLGKSDASTLPAFRAECIMRIKDPRQKLNKFYGQR